MTWNKNIAFTNAAASWMRFKECIKGWVTRYPFYFALKSCDRDESGVPSEWSWKVQVSVNFSKVTGRCTSTHVSVHWGCADRFSFSWCRDLWKYFGHPVFLSANNSEFDMTILPIEYQYQIIHSPTLENAALVLLQLRMFAQLFICDLFIWRRRPKSINPKYKQGNYYPWIYLIFLWQNRN